MWKYTSVMFFIMYLAFVEGCNTSQRNENCQNLGKMYNWCHPLEFKLKDINDSDSLAWTLKVIKGVRSEFSLTCYNLKRSKCLEEIEEIYGPGMDRHSGPENLEKSRPKNS